MFLRSLLEPSTSALSRVWKPGTIPTRGIVVPPGKSVEVVSGFRSRNADIEPLQLKGFKPSQRSKDKERESSHSPSQRGRAPKHYSVSEEAKFRTKVIERDGKRIKLLTPNILSSRITRLCHDDKLSEAIEMVKNSPKDAQNSAVWAVLIGFTMEKKKYKEAFRLFTDMKRRGIKPTSRTYGTLLKGYTQIEDWSAFKVQLENVCNLWDQLQAYVENVGRDPDLQSDLSNIPYNLLIEIFGKAKDYQSMFDVYNSMDADGPILPDIFTYTILLNSIANRKTLQPSPSLAALGGDLLQRNADDAKLIWRQLLRTCGTPDTHSVRAVLVTLSRGCDADQKMVLDIARDYLGLSEPNSPVSHPKISLHGLTLNLILAMCNKTERYHHTLNYVEQAKNSNRRSILTREHIGFALEAHACLSSKDSGQAAAALETLEWMLQESALPQTHVRGSGIGPQIRPRPREFDAVALTCLRNSDWDGMCRTFELLTGHKCDEFRGPTKRPRPNFGAPQVVPSVPFIAWFLQLARSTGDHANMRLALHIFGFYEPMLTNRLAYIPAGSADADAIHEVKRRRDSLALADVLKDILPFMMESANESEVKVWNAWLKHAKKVQATGGKTRWGN